MTEDDYKDRIKILEQQLSACAESAKLIASRNEKRINELKTACMDAIECNFTARKFIIENAAVSNQREYVASEILITSNRLRLVVKGKALT